MASDVFQLVPWTLLSYIPLSLSGIGFWVCGTLQGSWCSTEILVWHIMPTGFTYVELSDVTMLDLLWFALVLGASTCLPHSGSVVLQSSMPFPPKRPLSISCCPHYVYVVSTQEQCMHHPYVSMGWVGDGGIMFCDPLLYSWNEWNE